MKRSYRKVRTTHPSGTLLLFFSLLASISLTPSEYVDCESLFPDENMELFGTLRISHIQPLPLHVSSLVGPSALNYSSGSLLLLWVFFSPSITARVALAATLRC